MIDPALGAGPGLAYLGVPLAEAFRREVTIRTGTATVLHAQHFDGFRLLTHGLPPEAIIDIGRPHTALSSESAR